ncbi:hypothetical protein [Streptomyces sp. NPDC021212]|uniref:hypothetical protein n=1 Tax=Streptomyces sp. NPDC021212 TaxID=3365118 RepID=UPI0037901667
MADDPSATGTCSVQIPARIHAVGPGWQAEAERTGEFCGAPGSIRTRDDRLGVWRKAVCGTCHSAWSRIAS